METLSELLAQQAALEQQLAALAPRIAQARQAERGDAVVRVKALMAEHGLSLADLGLRASTPSGRDAKPAAAKVPPKFRHPETGQTWSGRGLKPTWLTAALAAGKRIEDFAL